MPSNQDNQSRASEDEIGDIAELSERSLTSEQAGQVRGGMLSDTTTTLSIKGANVKFNPKELIG
jgi:hypothetical protein